MYQAIRQITSLRSALVFSEENWLLDCQFSKCERSVYFGQNHIDVQSINRSDNSYEWIASNHILEHVHNDVKGLKEMYRILSLNGILQLTVPTPSRVFSTKDWGFADSSKMGHYRNYGADELAETVARVTGFKGELLFDTTKPDGTPRKLLDVSRLKALGWQASISLEDGLRSTYHWFQHHQDTIRNL